MRDDEIRTTPKSSFIPEQDIKLVKAFGKFVEEAGELLEITTKIIIESSVLDEDKYKLEDEIADCQAMTTIITAIIANSDYLVISRQVTSPLHPDITLIEALNFINHHIASSLAIIGRCQIQGLHGEDPNTHKPNLLSLANRITTLRRMLDDLVITHAAVLDAPRIEQRWRAKIDLKLPWIMEPST